MPQRQQYYQAGPQEGGVVNGGPPPRQAPGPPPGFDTRGQSNQRGGNGFSGDLGAMIDQMDAMAEIGLPEPWRRLWDTDPIPRSGGPLPGGGWYNFVNPPSGDYVDAGANPGAVGGGYSWDTDWGRFKAEGGVQAWSGPDGGSSRKFPFNWHPHPFAGLGWTSPGGKWGANAGLLIDPDNGFRKSEYGAGLYWQP